MKRNPGILIKGACCAVADAYDLPRALLLFECFFLYFDNANQGS